MKKRKFYDILIANFSFIIVQSILAGVIQSIASFWTKKKLEKWEDEKK